MIRVTRSPYFWPLVVGGGVAALLLARKAYSAALGAYPTALPGFVDGTSVPVQEKDGLFWVSDAVREQAARLIGTSTTFVSVEDADVMTQAGAAYAGASGSDWVAAALAKGYAVLVAPSDYAAPALRVILTNFPHRLAWEASRALQGSYAILAAPAALAAAASADAKAGSTSEPDDYWADSPPTWVLPVALGAAGLGVAALVVAFRRKSSVMSARPNAPRRGHARTWGSFGAVTGRTSSRLQRRRRAARISREDARVFDLLERLERKGKR